MPPARTLHPGRRVERTGLHVHRRRMRSRLSPAIRRMDSAASRWIGPRICRRADRWHRAPSRDLAERETGQRAGFRGVAQLYRLRPRRSEGAGGIGGRFVAGMAHGKVSYAAAYGGERIPAYLFLPKNATPPYQVWWVFPGANVDLRALQRGDHRLRSIHLHHAERPRLPCTPSTRARSSVAMASRAIIRT